MKGFKIKREFTYLVLALLLSNNLNAQYTVGNSYYGVNQYIEYIAGDMPLIIVAPHAGNLQPTSLPDINTRGNDNGTMDLVRFMADSLHLFSGGCRPHIIINHLRPSKLNPVHSANDSAISAGTNPIALQALSDFHNFIDIAHNKVSTDWGNGHYLELHGNGTAEKWNMVGLGISKTDLNDNDVVLNTKVNNSTIKHLCTAGGANFLEVLKGPTSLGGMLDSLGWKSSPSPAHPNPPDTVTFFYAGQNTWRYGSKNTGTIDATHLESYWEFMVKTINRYKYSNDLAQSMIRFMKLHYGFSFNCNAVSIREQEYDALKIKLFPNPLHSGQSLHIETDKKIEEILILNSFGQVCDRLPSDNLQKVIYLVPGIYTIEVRFIKGVIVHKNMQVL